MAGIKGAPLAKAKAAALRIFAVVLLHRKNPKEMPMPPVSFRLEQTPPRVIATTDAGEQALPALWLRERCQDEASLDHATQQRLFDPHRLPHDLRLEEARADGDALWLAFSDGYAGSFDTAAFLPDFDASDGCPDPVAWRAGEAPTHRHAWPQVEATDAGLAAALGQFLAYGYVVLSGVPCERDAILDVAARFGYVRDTNFGRLFEVYSRPNANDLAYTGKVLGPHTDNPYRDPVPGIQLLHCLINETTGGLSTLVDSKAVCQALEEEMPGAIALLAKHPVRFRFVDATTELIDRGPIVELDAAGRVSGLRYSPRLDYLPLMPEDEMRAFHKARARLGELLSDPAFEMRFLLGAGELMMFDNSRVLHGRTSFDPNEGRRHLQGCYIDIDEPRSRYRVLGRRGVADQQAA